MSSFDLKWREVSLGEVCEFKYGKSLKAANRAGGEISVYGSNGVVGHHDEPITEGPTIIVGRKGSFGEVNFSDKPCWPIDTTYFVDRTATEHDLKWLSYRLNALGLTNLNKSAAVPGLNRDDAYRQRLLLPPLSEQKRIAEILDRAEALRAKRRAALALLDELTQSIFLDMFGDPVSNPKGWPVRVFDDVCDSRLGKMLDAKKQVGDNPRPYMRNINVQWGRLDLSTVWQMDFNEKDREEFRLLPDDVLICEGGAGVAQTAVWRGDIAECYFQKSLHRVRPKPCSATSEYIAFLIRMLMRKGSELFRLVSSATIPHLTGVKLKTLRIPVPPVQLQCRFGVATESVAQQKARMQASLSELDQLFASLQHRAFRGEL